MKKFLSVLMALLMVLSVLSLASCKKETADGDDTDTQTETTEAGGEKEPSTNAELFSYALEQFVTPEILADSVWGITQFNDVNHVNVLVDKLEVAIPGVDSIPAIPQLEIDEVFTSEKSGIITLGATLADESVKFVCEMTEDGDIYVSMPDVTEKYLAMTLEQLAELADFESDFGDINETFEIFTEMYEITNNPASYIVKEENLTKESAEVDVFGESVTLDKLTLTLDRDTCIDILEEITTALFEILPEDVTGGEMPDFDELREDMKDTLTIDVAFSFYLDGKDVKKFTFDAAVEYEGEKVELTSEFDVLNSAEEYKLKGDVLLSVLGEEMVKLTVVSDMTLKDGKLDGTTEIIPELNLEAMDAPAEVVAVLDDIKIVFEMEGELEKNKFDIDLTYGITVAGITVKLPIALKGEKDGDKFTLDVDVDFNLMGVKLDLSVVIFMEKLKDVKAGSYDPDNAVDVEDDDAMEELGEELEEYFLGLEKFAEFINSFGGTDSDYVDPDYEISVDNDYFGIYDDEIEAVFYSDGQGVITYDYELEYDAVAGTFTAYQDGEELFVITLTGVETAESDGYEFVYEIYEYGDGDIDYNFYSEELDVELEASPWCDSIRQYSYFEYSYDDTTITINGETMEYSVDEAEGIMILGGDTYTFYGSMR